MRLLGWGVLGLLVGSTLTMLSRLAWDEVQWRLIERRAGRARLRDRDAG
jgi:hypothetical protein